MPFVESSSVIVWIIEDDRKVREALQALLASRYRIRTFETAEGGLMALEKLQERPDVLLLDLGLPGLSGLEALERFRSRIPELRIVVLTVFNDPDTIFRALCAGASGYLLKSGELERVSEAVEEARQGGAPLDPVVAARVLEMFRRFPVPQHTTLALSEREKEVLRALAEGLSKPQIARRMGLSVHTVDAYVRTIYEKLHVHNRTAAVARALREGLI